MAILKSLTRAVAAAAAVTLAGVTFSTTASATTATVHTISYKGVQAQVDNSPGSGASWAWIYSGAKQQGMIQYEFYDGTWGELTANSGGSNSATLSQDVWRFQACVWNTGGGDQGPYWDCSSYSTF